MAGFVDSVELTRSVCWQSW